MAGKVIEGPVTIRGDLVVTGRLNKGSDTAQANNGKALQVIQGVLQPVVTQPNVVPQSGDLRMYGQNSTINGNVVPGGTDGYFQIDEYINGAWQHLFEVMPSTTGNANVLDLFISGRLFARDSLLSAPGRFFFKPAASPFGSYNILGCSWGNGVFVAVGDHGQIARSTDNGITWGSLIPNPFGTTLIAAVAYGNNVFIAVDISGRASVSHDYGVTWAALVTTALSGPAASITFGGGVFVVGGGGGHIVRSTNNGASWSSLIPNPFGVYTVYGLSFGNGIFVAVADHGEIALSVDLGITWGSLIPNPFGTSTLYNVCFGNGVFIALGATGKLAKSTDGGNSWGSLITTPLGTDAVDAVGFGSGVFLIASTTGKACISLDLGITWGIKYGDNAYYSVLGTAAYAIATNSFGQSVIVGYDSSNISIAYSDYVEAGAGIVESGSNSNGSWIKFADGTMVCKIIDPVNGIPGSKLVNLPIAYIDTSYVVMTNTEYAAGGNIIFGASLYSKSTTQFGSNRNYIQGAGNVSGGDNIYEYLIIGRWK